ncbi:MAG: hypothetical protein JXB05_17710 [Myxococcaceae bacterium]|nr:hypothetical protein [Myxococcaceae bacterium]
MSFPLKNSASFALSATLLGFLLGGCIHPRPEQHSHEIPGKINYIPDNPTTRAIAKAPEPVAPTPEQLRETLEAGSRQSLINLTPDVPRQLEPSGPASAQTESPDLARAHTGTTCIINFNDPYALALDLDHSYDSFAYWYIPYCGNNQWAYVQPTGYTHFHLSFESSAYCFGTVPGKVGVMQNGQCVQTGLDAANVPRNLSPHSNTERVKFYVQKRYEGIRPFNLNAIYIPRISDNPQYGHIQVWIRKVDGSWRYWPDLAPGYNWYFPLDSGEGITELQITSPGNYGWTIDDTTITIPQ